MYKRYYFTSYLSPGIFFRALIPVLAISLLSAGLPGCARIENPPPDQAAAAGSLHTGRIIIRFRDPQPDLTRKTVLHSLSQDAGLFLVYVRPMSGGAHVLQAEDQSDRPVSPEALTQAVRRLAARPDVEYVELDQRMRHFLPKPEPDKRGDTP